MAKTRPRHTVHSEHKVEGFQHDMGRAIAKRLLVAVHDPALTIHRQALGGDRRASDVAEQAFQAAALMRFANGGGMAQPPGQA
jgi:hypothetical protein